MTKKQPPTPEECERILKQKLEEITDETGDEKSNFIASFALDLPFSPEIENVDNDKLRETAFYGATLEGVKHAQQLLEECEIPYKRPPDMFAEMVKTEAQMERTRKKLEDQKQAKETIAARNKEKRELKEKVVAPKQNEQKRPGQLMKPQRNTKQQKERQQRRERQQKKGGKK